MTSMTLTVLSNLCHPLILRVVVMAVDIIKTMTIKWYFDTIVNSYFGNLEDGLVNILIQQNCWSKELHHGPYQRRHFQPAEWTLLGYRLTTKYSWLVQLKLLNLKDLCIYIVSLCRGYRWFCWDCWISWWSYRV